MVPVSVIIVTKNEESRLADCLAAFSGFDAPLIVVDSASHDKTCAIARAYRARIVPFTWDGHYPKKRQWCLDHLALAHEWVWFVDADEIVSPALLAEIKALFSSGAPPCNGYFIESRYRLDGILLRYGLRNKKLCLFDRRELHFPYLDDLALDGMGEIEGHYQPVRRPGHGNAVIGVLKNNMEHRVDDVAAWRERHRSYALWESGMNAGRLWPRDPVFWRDVAKTIFRAVPLRGEIMFLYGYILRSGFLDGAAGLRWALMRRDYYRMIAAASKSPA